MPNEKNKKEEVRNNSGKKSVTKRSSASSQTTASRSASTSKTASASGKSRSTGTSNRSTSTKTTSAKSTSSASKTTSAQTKPRQSSGTKPKTTSSAAKTAPKTKSAVNANTKTKNGTKSMSERAPMQKNGTDGRSRQNTSARDDFRLFSEDTVRDAERKRKTEQAKKTAAQSARRSSAPHKKGKSQSRSKLVTVLTYAMMIFAFAALMVTLSLTVFFKIDNIKVTYIGTEYYSEDSIITLSGIEEGENIFSVPADKIENKIEENMPYIEKCEVKRAFPTGINIKVTGANPAGIVTLQTGMRIVISEEGKTLETLPPEVSGSDAMQAVSDTDASNSDIPHNKYGSGFINESKLPVIIGLNITEGMEEGKYIKVDDETAMPILKQLIELLYAYELPPKKIDLSAGNLYSYYDNRIEIKLGSGTQLEAKIKMAHEIILSRLSAYDSGRVDVTNPAKSYFTPGYMLG